MTTTARSAPSSAPLPLGSASAAAPSSWRRAGFYAAAVIVPLVTASIWYVVFGATWIRLSGVDPAAATSPSLWPMLGQIARNAVVVVALAVLASRLRIRTVRGALALGALVWLGFEAMSILGSVLHESYPVALYLIHVGDALQTTLVMTFFIGLARRRPARLHG